jgi:protocatechuate 3,4-dioxygenase beta subunit
MRSSTTSRAVLATLTLAVLGTAHAAARAADLAPTPPQPKGPFYPIAFPPESDTDLTRLGVAQARGQAIVVTGRILRSDGTPVPGARVEIWQTNVHGRYHHEHDDSPAPLDPGFQGWGETRSDALGNYSFRTVKPAAYSGRAPHIHFAVTLPGGRPFYTQLYLADAAENAADFLFQRLSAAQRQRLVARLEGGPAPTARFDIVLP